MNDQEEILVVVDEDDQIIDYLPRSEVHARKMLHRTISVITYNSQGQIVLQKRSMNKDTNPGMLGNAVGGHVTKGQSYEEAASTEAEEELGRKLSLIKLQRIILEDPEHRTMTTIFKTVADGPFKFNKDEIDEIITVDPQDLPEMMDKLSPSSKLIFKAAGVLQ